MRRHVVTRANAPFLTGDGRLEVHQIPSWEDNLIWLLVCSKTQAAGVVDGPHGDEVLSYCEQRGLRLTTVLNTHTHWDHVGINRDFAKRGLLDALTVYGSAKVESDVPGITHPVGEGDSVRIGEVSGQVWLTEGHIDGHISYLFDDALFCGDTMFAAGCGYLFDGPPAKMYASLNRIAQLPGHTRVCCAHEYTQDNLRFAWSLEPDNAALAKRIREVWTVRSNGGCTIPFTVDEERASSPFLRCTSETLLEKLREAWPERSLQSPEEIFAATRALKDRKDYRTIPDSDLPL